MTVSGLRTTTCLPLATSLAALLCVTLDLRAADWPQWRGLKRDGVSYETGWMTNWPPTPVWTNTSIGAGFASVTVKDGRLYTVGYTTAGADSNVVFCLDALTGTQIWAKAFLYTAGRDGGYPGPRATPTVQGDEVYFFSNVGKLYCLNKLTGSNVWTTTVDIGRVSPSSTDWGYSSSPLVEGDLVIVNSGKGAAVNRNTGAIVWTNSGNAGYAAPVPYTATNGERVVIMFSSDSVNGLVATNGKKIWSYPWSTSHDAHTGDPILYKDKVFISSGYGKGCALIQLGTASPTAVWSNTRFACKTSSVILDGDYVYGIKEPDYGGDGTLKCLDLRTGTVAWSSPSIDGEGALSAADGALIVLDASARLRLVKLTPTNYVSLGATLKIAGSGECRSAPVLYNGRIYTRYQTSVVCYRVGPEPESDGDADGIPDVWEQKHFTGAANCGPTDDSDGDGVSNRDEYLAGTDPTNIQSCVCMTATNTGGKLVFNTPTIKAQGTGYMARARFYTMESSTGLTGAAWSPFLDCMNIVGTNAPIYYTNAPSGSRKFYRMKVTLE